jgi:hypothetical protein
MRSREYLFKRIENLEAKLKTLNFLLKRGSTVGEFEHEIKFCEEILEDIKSVIEREPMTPNEINRF